jgi:hypothetical protein
VGSGGTIHSADSFAVGWILQGEVEGRNDVLLARAYFGSDYYEYYESAVRVKNFQHGPLGLWRRRGFYI